MKSLPHILLSYAASVRDTDSHQIPLQIICSSSQRAPIEVFQKLVSANPQEVAFQPPGKGSSPLHTLARHSYVEAIAVLAEANPAAHMLRDHDWRLPFDAAKNDEVRSLMVKHYFQFGLAGELFKNSSDEILEVRKLKIYFCCTLCSSCTYYRLSHLMLFSKKQLELAVREYVQFYNTQRPHQGLDNEIPIPPKFIGNGEIVCKERLGGLLKFYERQVA